MSTSPAPRTRNSTSTSRPHGAARRSRLAVAGVVVAVVAALGLDAWTPAFAAPQDRTDMPEGGVTTLYQHDALGSSLSFRLGGHGGRIVEGQIDLSQAQLVYGGFESGQLSFGFSADEAVNIVDLGPLLVEPIQLAQDAAMKYPISAFETLGVANRKLVYQPAGGAVVRLGAGNDVFGVPRRGLISFEPRIGNCYVLRYQQTRRDRRDVLAKFQVVEHRPGESITLRWANIGAL